MKFVKKVYNVFIHLSIVIWIKQIFVTIKNSIGEIIDTSNNFIYNLIVIFLLPINFLIMLIEYLHEKVKKSGKRLIEKIVHLISLFIKAIFIIPIEFISNFIMGIKSISDRIRHNIKRRKVSKIAEKYAKLLKNCIILNGTIFFNSSFHYFTIVTTCSLQFISFFTTYSGTKYYFGNIIPFFPELAPFIITFMIQGSLVLLSNAMTIRDRINFKKIIALIGMCLISMFFSYTGIINYQIPPSKEMKRNYEDFYNKYENISNLYSSKHYGSVSEYIDKNCNSLETDAEQLSEDLKRLYNEMPTDISTAVSVSDNRTTTTSRIKNEKKSELRAEKGKLDYDREKLRQLDKSDFITKVENSEIDKQKITENLEALDKDEGTISFINAYNKLIIDYNNYAKKYEIGKDNKFEEINNLKSLYLEKIKIFNENNENKIKSYDEIVESVRANTKNFDDKNLENLSEISNQIIETVEIYEKSPFNNKKEADLDIKQGELDELRNAANKAKKITDFNVQALSYLTSNVYNSKAIPSLISAVFIDLMTVLLPLLLELPKRCILYVRSRKNLIYEEEDIIEKLLESIAPWDKKFINNVQSLKDLLSRFNDLFNITNGESFEKGFSLRCEEKELYNFVKNNPTMKSFIIFIKTCNYLYYDEKNIFEKIDVKNNGELKDTVSYYYLKSKFNFWLTDCISSLTQYIEDYNTIEEERKKEEEGKKYGL